MYLLHFLVPETHLESVKEAIFATGAGEIGHYAHCAWQTLGMGQFMPLSGSNAFIGVVDTLEKVAEYKVEIACEQTRLEAAVTALKKSHPYETPAYHVVKCEDI
ncbi:MAG: NGG1p interacting factor NIF3 [Gammaproteobacteria bacterium]|nr:NGG1p interacting factor NIF3 [Gammaproteobacteria bacterium]